MNHCQVIQLRRSMREVKYGVGRVQAVANPIKRNPQKFFHIYIIMQRHQLFDSLLSSSTSVIPDHPQQQSEMSQDLRRLNRKFMASLPEQKVQKKDKGKSSWLQVFNPQSKFIIAWQVINIFLIYIYFIQIPIAIAFDDHRNSNQILFQTVNYPVMVIFVVDIFVNFNTSFYQDGLLQSDPTQIRKKYMKSNLVVDVVSIAAIMFYEMIEIYDLQKYYLKLVLLVFFIRIKELMEIQRVILNSFDLNRKAKALLKLFLLIMKIMLICNVVACSGFFISNYLFNNNYVLDPREQICGSSSYWIIYTCEAGVPLRYCSFSVKYIYALYWASTTMITIGYGDITPKNVYEISFNIIIQFLSCLLYGYAINQIWMIIQELNAKKMKIHTRLSTINLYMRDKDIGSDLIHRVNGYLTNYYQARNLRQRDIEAEIIGQLTPSLKRQLYHQSYAIILKHRFFFCISQNVIISACQHVKEVSYFQDQSLSSRWNSQSPCLYYVKKGQFRQETGGKAHVDLRCQYKGDYIGVYQFITQLAYLSQLIADKYTLVYYLKYNHWRDSLIQQNEQCFQYFFQVKQRLMFYGQLDRIGYSCYFCDRHTHRSQLCFDQHFRHQIMKSYQHTRRSHSHERRQYARRKFIAPQMEKKGGQRKMSISKGIDPPPLFKVKHTSMMQNFLHSKGSLYDDVRSCRKVSDQILTLKRGGRFVGMQRSRYQTHRALENVQSKYANRSDKSDYGSDDVSQIMSLSIQIDTLANYDEYYPRFNPSQLNFKEQKKRATKSFYFL